MQHTFYYRTILCLNLFLIRDIFDKFKFIINLVNHFLTLGISHIGTLIFHMRWNNTELLMQLVYF